MGEDGEHRDTEAQSPPPVLPLCPSAGAAMWEDTEQDSDPCCHGTRAAAAPLSPPPLAARPGAAARGRDSSMDPSGSCHELSSSRGARWFCRVAQAVRVAAALGCFRPHPFHAVTARFVPPQQTSPGVGALVTKAAGERLVTQRIILLILCLFLARGGRSSHSKLSPPLPRRVPAPGTHLGISGRQASV